MAGWRAGVRLGCRGSDRRLRRPGRFGRRAGRGHDSRRIVGRSPCRIAKDVPGIVELDHPARIAAMVGVIPPRQDAVGRSDNIRFGSRMDLEHFIQVGDWQSLQRPSARGQPTFTWGESRCAGLATPTAEGFRLPRRRRLPARRRAVPTSRRGKWLRTDRVARAAGETPTRSRPRPRGPRRCTRNPRERPRRGPVAAELIEARPPPSPSASRAPAAERLRRTLPPRRP
jgi:hypothetical protein